MQPKENDKRAIEFFKCAYGLDPKKENMYEGFKYFCMSYCYIEDKKTHSEIKFKWYKCQEEVAKALVNGEWLVILKARRLGMTWLLAAYAIWLCTFFVNRSVSTIAQGKEYAEDFIDRCRAIWEKMPDWMRCLPTTDNKQRLDFNSYNHGCSVRSFACTNNTGRSTAADLVIFDEAAFPEYLRKAMRAVQPSVETGDGQMVLISTADGPQGAFYETWEAAQSKRGKFKPIFFSWKEHPNRNLEWYAKEKKENEADPLYMKREYPSTPEEAFESAEGRIYPLFVHSDKFIFKKTIHKDWKKFRGIDFGGVHPFVCLWGAIIPGDGAGLTVDPDCTGLIKELKAYMRDEKGKPKDEDNHACDALRYMVITPGADGIHEHLHIYREIYIPDSAAKGFSLVDLAKNIIDDSKPDKNIKQTICDRSRPDSIYLLNDMGIPSIGQRHMSGGRGSEIEQGIVRVNALVVGTSKAEKATPYKRLLEASGKSFSQGGIFA